MDSKIKTYGENVEYTEDTVHPILNWIVPNSNVLEFGPASGHMTRYLKQRLNCKVTCIELNEAMKSSLELYAERVIIADLDQENWNKELGNTHFDYILFSDVLEHLRDPLSALRRAAQFGNCILTSIPNIGHASILLSLLEGEFCYKKYGLLDDTHVHFFTRKSIEQMMHDLQFHCSDERSRINLYPSTTEFHKFYAKHPACALSIIRKRDSSVYQFINKWEKSDNITTIKESKGFKVSLSSSIKILLIDFIRYLYGFTSKKNNFILKIVQKTKQYI